MRLQRDKPPAPEDVAIPVTTAPGQVAQVDFFYVGLFLDPPTAKMRKCWAFVMLLAHSRHMFVDLVFDQRVETWQRLHAKAFVFFGGVPAVVVPDNLKAAVIRRLGEEFTRRVLSNLAALGIDGPDGEAIRGPSDAIEAELRSTVEYLPSVARCSRGAPPASLDEWCRGQEHARMRCERREMCERSLRRFARCDTSGRIVR